MSEPAECFRRGDYAGALAGYTAALAVLPDDPALFCNRSLAAYRLGRFADALADASSALEVLDGPGHGGPSSAAAAMRAKARYRQGAAWMGLSQPDQATEVLRVGLSITPRDPDLARALRASVAACSPTQLAAAAAAAIREAERPPPAALSSRDGSTLKPVRRAGGLSASDLEKQLCVALGGPATPSAAATTSDSDEASMVVAGDSESDDLSRGRGMRACHLVHELRARLTRAWAKGKPVERATVACFRAVAYLHEDAEQAARDAQLARASCADWALPSAVLSWAAEARRQETGEMYSPEGVLLKVCSRSIAATEMRRAFELSPEYELYASELKRLARKLPEAQALLLVEQGAAAFVRWLADENERALPEFARTRPKYYYYYSWMRDRLAERFPQGLPEPVVDKLLELDAGELDLLLQYPQAIQGQAAEFVAVLEAQGAAGLAIYRSPTLSWEEVQALKGPGTVGLGLGYHAPGEGFLPAGAKDTNHALLGAAGDGGLTASERRGLPIATVLGPDHARDLDHITAATEEANVKLGLEAASGRQRAILDARQTVPRIREQ